MCNNMDILEKMIKAHGLWSIAPFPRVWDYTAKEHKRADDLI